MRKSTDCPAADRIIYGLASGKHMNDQYFTAYEGIADTRHIAETAERAEGGI